MACCMTLSRGDAIPSGRSLPFALGIYTRRFGLSLSDSERSFREVFSNHSTEIPSKVSLVVPLTMLPGLDLMVS